jgi:LPS-assembly protein
MSRIIPLFISTILLAVGHQHLCAQGVTPEEPPNAPAPNQNALQSTEAAQQAVSSSAQAEPSDDLANIPRATLLPSEKPEETAVLESDLQSKHGDVYYASGNAVLTYGDHILHADSITYDKLTADVTAEGHVVLTGGENNEHIEATHGTYNLNTDTGRFYDVHGSVAMEKSSPAGPLVTPTMTTPGTSGVAKPRAPGYQNSNPFLFEGRIVVKTGPEDYILYNGSVTTCLLPNPDWQLFARKINMDEGKARAAKATFTLLRIPLLFFPYVTHPTDAQERQSGLLIPEFGYSSASKDTGSKGTTIGEQVYIVLGRSADLTLGTIYYSLRGFSENGTFRYHGAGDNFFNAHFTALQDRGFYAPGVNAAGQAVTVFNNQGGEDITASFRRQLTPNIRAVGDAEYLSSFIYREAFTSNFNQAVSTDITSILYLTEQKNGFSADARVDRYEGLKVVQTDFSPGEEVKIYHAPSLDFTGLDHPIPSTPFLWSITASAAGLKRVEPNFATAGLTWRLDLRPELALPLRFDGWHMLSSIAVRETAYTRSRQTPYGNNATPVQLKSPLNRSDVDINVDLRPPAVERAFTVPERWRWLFGDEVRHTIEPDITYRNTHGIDNFLGVLRFDDVDLASDTDELQYGVTQHLYFRPHAKTPKPMPGCAAKPVTPTISGTAANDTATDTTAADPTTDTTADTLSPDERASTDANGIANAAAPDQPLRTHAHKSDPCAQPSIPPQQEWFSWVLTQKHFFEPTFGGAVIDERRNIFDTTLDFSGVAFLTQPRSISPLKSRMRFRTSSHADIAWDFDYDTGAKKFTSSNTFLDVHEGKVFGGFSYARLNAPGKTYTEVIDTTTNEVTGLTSSAISNFSQMRLLLGYGKPSDAGFSGAVSSGIDLKEGSAQYITIQTNYNWNCCGLAVELRHYDLGTIRDEWAPTFSFTLANIGSAGTLRRAASLF